MQVWVDGMLVPEHEALLLSNDHGFVVGDGVFETAKVAGGRPFALGRHLDRLCASARGLGLPEPDQALVRRAVDEVVSANVTADGPGHRLRITYTSGPGPLGSARGSAGPTLVVASSPLDPTPATTAVATVPWPRNERGALAGLKTTSYAENVVALARAKAAGASEALFADTTGRLCEGTGSNVFVVVGGEVLTPTLATGCLAGVTRALVLEWTDAREADLPLSVLEEADEVFLTSTTRDVQGVHAVDGRELPAPGKRTTQIAEEFARRAAETDEP